MRGHFERKHRDRRWGEKVEDTLGRGGKALTVGIGSEVMVELVHFICVVRLGAYSQRGATKQRVFR